ncbi:MAG: hypothetical protein A2287_01720 [Candidatus Melainabacteria bacterium RIFOXYA12_FULL_32_12]|nr:MAG: hypothetical protein A2255_01600 [Candidatus Melainabacteria bacterium RIFOXYA2_FULL_32_9]OGI28075.1 MAG: hypothetical protein A2287_01720 [Candidatus Melainabacteria bacterium RIFOXYA12_FULL_32_12]
MFESSRQEYSVKFCSSDDPEDLESLLNKMSEEGWELYTLHETESKKGGLQYNCIFYREYADEEAEGDGIVDVDNFKTRMEKMMNPSNEPYEECKEIQRRINYKQEEIVKIKSLLDSISSNIDRNKLNDEMSEHLKELNDLKNQLSDAIDPIYMFDRINQDKLTIIISDELLDLVDIAKNGDLITETINLRQKLVDKLGYVVPAIKFTDSETLEANAYRIDVRGIKVLSGFIYSGYRRFQVGQTNISRKPKDAIGDIDVINGQSVFWIEESKTKNYWEQGLSPAQVIANNLEYIVCRYVDEILDYSDINNYIDIVSNHNLYLIDNLIPDYLSVGDLRYIFAGLIREKISVKDLVFIFEKINDFVQDTVEKEILLEKTRAALGRQICSNIADLNGNIYGIEISENFAETLEDLLVQGEEKDYFDPKDPKISRLIKNIINIVKDVEYDISNMAIIAPAYIRLQFFYLFEQFIPGLSVISRNEVVRGFNLEIFKSLDSL